MADPAPETDLIRSPLHDRHEALGAKTAPFGGWTMPLEYAGGGVVKEHTAVREAVGIFDVSHLGKATVTGPGAAALVNATLSNDLGRIEPGKAQYTLCVDDETGGVVDDLIVYHRDDEHLLLVPNAANTAEVVRRLAAAAAADHPGVTVTDEHCDHAVLAVQGPRADDVLAAVGLPTGHDYMTFVDTTVTLADGRSVPDVVVCRTGYTGERGYELVVPAAHAVPVWDALVAAVLEAGGLPAGLGARDTLRTEMGYPLHGQDISMSISPNEARLGWAVGWSKERFWGKDVLTAEKEAGPRRRLRGLRAAGRGIPRPSMTVRAADGQVVGEITSGTFSPTLRTGVALALLDAAVTPGDEVTVDVRNRSEAFTVVAPPFVDTSVRS